ncbi:MAG: phosphatidate cytidylyltransferase [candidate division WOR-3 bacterium]|nr:phosphatidate cytidylyltransferase [candidate division WOR-3 bacterium]MCX7757694.1 phosphatidate cytidylyltransferase [candidate division WOR-3 bacterium]MDW7987430.1 phosphatidate cytidylyltransferase [candidate division WOR-3 bacterium]
MSAKVTKLGERTLIGLFLVSSVLLVLYGPVWLMVIFSIFWILMATGEFYNLLKKYGISLPKLIMLVINGLFPILYYLTKSFYPYLFLTFVIFIYALAFQKKFFSFVPHFLFSMFYLGFLPSHLLYLKDWIWSQDWSLSKRFLIALYPLGFTWINDTGGYIVGSLIGKHYLAPQISPRKTYEGFIAGVIFGVGFSIIYLGRVFNFTTSKIIVTALFLSCGALVGDLLESGFKREAGVKDSSSLLGAHGGFLDRIDSLIITVPLFYYLLKLFLT